MLAKRVHLWRHALEASAIIGGYLLVAATVFERLEDWTWFESLYYATVTITTVGYGDLSPTNNASRMATMIFILIFIPMFFTMIGIVADGVFTYHQEGLKKSWLPRLRVKKKRRR